VGDIALAGGGITGRMGVKRPNDLGVAAIGGFPNTLDAARRQLIGMRMITCVFNEEQFKRSAVVGLLEDGSTHLTVSLGSCSTGCTFESKIIYERELVGRFHPLRLKVGSILIGR
tara:strand:+ start:1489 stop:1833 length:345 start_codon:yes stop_codon:yes gene_type:complete